MPSTQAPPISNQHSVSLLHLTHIPSSLHSRDAHCSALSHAPKFARGAVHTPSLPPLSIAQNASLRHRPWETFPTSHGSPGTGRAAQVPAVSVSRPESSRQKSASAQGGYVIDELEPHSSPSEVGG
jgi:hypothetical protein